MRIHLLTQNSQKLIESDPTAAYQSWTLLTSLPVTLFYFSIWKLALAGPEFSSLTALSPVLLGFPPVLSFAVSRGGRAVFAGAAGAIGIGLWWAESMWVRLAAAMIGVFCTSIRWAGEWQSDINRGYHATGMRFPFPWAVGKCNVLTVSMVMEPSVFARAHSVLAVKALEPREQSRCASVVQKEATESV